jgi:1-deoxy-D-xylulose-5-phosphate reductoisomerase
LAERIGFLDIAAIVSEVLERYDPPAPQVIADVIAVDAEARRVAAAAIQGRLA